MQTVDIESYRLSIEISGHQLLQYLACFCFGAPKHGVPVVRNVVVREVPQEPNHRNRISREELHFVVKLINWLCES